MSADLSVEIEISPGELLDRLTILEIKLEKIQAPEKRRNVEAEHGMLARARAAALPEDADVLRLEAELKAVNLRLWEIEDDIRDCERRQDFGAAFVRLARDVYRTNDRRAALKRAVNDRLGAKFVEEKSYAVY
ncbi:MAG: DUF6165 family protein [Alphaproteobacteria bacterium]